MLFSPKINQVKLDNLDHQQINKWSMQDKILIVLLCKKVQVFIMIKFNLETKSKSIAHEIKIYLLNFCL